MFQWFSAHWQLFGLPPTFQRGGLTLLWATSSDGGTTRRSVCAAKHRISIFFFNVTAAAEIYTPDVALKRFTLPRTPTTDKRSKDIPIDFAACSVYLVVVPKIMSHQQFFMRVHVFHFLTLSWLWLTRRRAHHLNLFYDVSETNNSWRQIADVSTPCFLP